ncbi:hypothetical protein O181_033844 [Austropuccinia psidii MF-1]|uniref:NADP-dependent oxidoreductase domain-containing protein n=1 Tax=Austropuccinia psidii MF-1 TaxID=1389203 RepID=A0A9Q3CZJ5_9BASI|nr:hypothetical protein [Austropuccinia psidii MF-1]
MTIESLIACLAETLGIFKTKLQMAMPIIMVIFCYEGIWTTNILDWVDSGITSGCVRGQRGEGSIKVSPKLSLEFRRSAAAAAAVVLAACQGATVNKTAAKGKSLLSPRRNLKPASSHIWKLNHPSQSIVLPGLVFRGIWVERNHGYRPVWHLIQHFKQTQQSLPIEMSIDIVSNRKIAGQSLASIGYGLMRLTWTPNPPSEEKAFEAILTFLKSGGNLLNTGEFYGNPPDHLNDNLELLARFFNAYPQWAQEGKCFISAKGGMNLDNGKINAPDGSMEGLRRSVENINKKLGGQKKMDLFQMARVDQTRPIEEVIKNMKVLINEGHFKHIGLSEASAQTIRRAHAVHPIAAVEVEYSPWALEIESNGVLDICKELGIVIIAYSPLGLGMLTGKIKSPDDIPLGDMRHHFERFQPENFYHNLKLAQDIEEVANRKGSTPTQITLSWLLAQCNLIIPIPGSSRAEGVKEALGSLKVQLSDEETKKIREVVDKADIKGVRYNAHHQASLFV